MSVTLTVPESVARDLLAQLGAQLDAPGADPLDPIRKKYRDQPGERFMTAIRDEGERDGDEYRVPRSQTRRRALQAGYTGGGGIGGYFDGPLRKIPALLRHDGDDLLLTAAGVDWIAFLRGGPLPDWADGA
jgi:hypothetical protein